ncbi:MAG: hypothetical protein AAF587_40985 [Bacteroidota bacterium]
MKTKHVWRGIILAVCLLWIRLFVGVYEHDEYLSHHYFIKHSPTWQWYFYSPIGYQNKDLEDLSLEEKWQERAFHEFVRNQGHSR